MASELPSPRKVSALTPIWRVRLAWIVAIAADLFQLGTFPLAVALTPVWNNVVDVVVGVVLVSLLGWHGAFIPTFVVELLPFADLFPTWTAAVYFVTRDRSKRGGTSTT